MKTARLVRDKQIKTARLNRFLSEKRELFQRAAPRFDASRCSMSALTSLWSASALSASVFIEAIVCSMSVRSTSLIPNVRSLWGKALNCPGSL